MLSQVSSARDVSREEPACLFKVKVFFECYVFGDFLMTEFKALRFLFKGREKFMMETGEEGMWYYHDSPSWALIMFICQYDHLVHSDLLLLSGVL